MWGKNCRNKDEIDSEIMDTCSKFQHITFVITLMKTTVFYIFVTTHPFLQKML